LLLTCVAFLSFVWVVEQTHILSAILGIYALCATLIVLMWMATVSSISAA
jgi:hypothetical protein